jgi:hypothetical protein
MHPHTIPATSLTPGDQIRDRGALHTIDEIQHGGQLRDCLIVIMEDAGRLGIPLTAAVTVWRTTP